MMIVLYRCNGYVDFTHNNIQGLNLVKKNVFGIN